MPTFTIFIEDTRYAVPTVVLLDVDDEGRAATVAKMRLMESHHHLAVELCEGGKLVARFGRPA